MVNELGENIPDEVVVQALAKCCAGDARYVYIDNDYDGGFPVASIDVDKPRRFRSTNYEKHKEALCVVNGVAYVAFRSPSASRRLPIERVPDHEIPELPSPRINEETNTYAIDDTPLTFVVEDGFIVPSTQTRIKAFCIQLLKIDDSGDYAKHHYEVRIAYYMVAHKGKRRGSWQFGQFAPMMTPPEYQNIHQEIQTRGWLTRFAEPVSLPGPNR